MSCQHSVVLGWSTLLWHVFIWSEGLPTLIHQPEDRNVTRNTPFTLTCEAVGPPDPVQIRWLRDGLPDSDFHNSPRNYSVSGKTLNAPSSFQLLLTLTEMVCFTVTYSVPVTLVLPSCRCSSWNVEVIWRKALCHSPYTSCHTWWECDAAYIWTTSWIRPKGAQDLLCGLLQNSHFISGAADVISSGRKTFLYLKNLLPQVVGSGFWSSCICGFVCF